jgi:GNAT superfamily N-acetyltransferase
MNALRQQLSAAIPERADTVWCRALLKLGETQAFGTLDDAVIVHSEAGLGVLWGRPSPALAREAFAACGTPTHLVASAPCALGPAWSFQPARLLTLPPSREGRVAATRVAEAVVSGGGGGASGALGFAAQRVVEARAQPLSPQLWRSVPAPLASVLADAMERGQVFCVEEEGRAVSFARTAFRSELWFDVVVDTLEPFRRRGFGRAAAQALMEREGSKGRAPVVAAPAADAAALALVRSLGLVDSGAPLVLGRHG